MTDLVQKQLDVLYDLDMMYDALAMSNLPFSGEEEYNAIYSYIINSVPIDGEVNE